MIVETADPGACSNRKEGFSRPRFQPSFGDGFQSATSRRKAGDTKMGVPVEIAKSGMRRFFISEGQQESECIGLVGWLRYKILSWMKLQFICRATPSRNEMKLMAKGRRRSRLQLCGALCGALCERFSEGSHFKVAGISWPCHAHCLRQKGF